MDRTFLISWLELFGSTINNSLDNFLTECVMRRGDPMTLVEYFDSTPEVYKVIYICTRISEDSLVVISRYKYLFAV